MAGFGIVDVASHDRAVELAARFAAIVQARTDPAPDTTATPRCGPICSS